MVGGGPHLTDPEPRVAACSDRDPRALHAATQPPQPTSASPSTPKPTLERRPARWLTLLRSPARRNSEAMSTTSAGNPRGDRLLDAATVLATCAVAHAVAQLNPTADVGAGDTA
jgi:hypothetical protein